MYKKSIQNIKSTPIQADIAHSYKVANEDYEFLCLVPNKEDVMNICEGYYALKSLYNSNHFQNRA